MTGGIGLAAGANIGDKAAMFEATHGTAPKYTGKNMANPGAVLLSGALLLEFMGWFEAAKLVLANDEFRGALAKRGVTDPAKVFCSPITAGYFALPEHAGKRVIKVGCYDLRRTTTNMWGWPIERLYAVVNVNAFAVSISGSSPYWDNNVEFWISKNDPRTSTDGGVYAEIIMFTGWHASRLQQTVGWPCDKSGSVTVVMGEVNRPNGLCFSPDERKMYVVEAGLTPRVIKVFDVVDNGTKLANGRAFVTCAAPVTPDGFRCDVDGNLWCGWGMGEGHDGVVVFNPDGKRIGKINLPERCANLCFGGLRRNRLFMAASHSLYSLYVNTQGVKGG
jgi:hypothetical protein